MTVKELKTILEQYPDDMTVVYNYDTGHGFPTFKRAYILDESAYDYALTTGTYKGPILCLDED